MIHHPLLVPSNREPARKEESEHSHRSSRFRDMMRKVTKKSANQHEDPDSSQSLLPPPSLFALIRQDLLEAEEKNLHSDPVCAALSAPLTTSSDVDPIIGSQEPSPVWSTILESASHGISHVLAEEITETTLQLDGPLFAGTPLEGTKLIVREYSTAPLAFNIHFVCAPVGLAYLQPQLKTLSTLFQNRRYPFSIHSVDADLGDGVPPPIERTGDDQEEKER